MNFYQMEEYKNYSIEDFLGDQFFHRWATNPLSIEAQMGEAWLLENPQMVEVVREAKSILLAMAAEPKTLPIDFHEKIKARIDLTIAEEEIQGSTFNFYGWLKVAAVIIGLVVGVKFLFPTGKTAEAKSYSSGYGETKTIGLPDGSQVLLNAHSAIRYSKSSEDNTREVWLEGEAFFSVKHIENSKKVPEKFVVHANGVDVQVLGTEFNVNARHERVSQVLLTNGKVALTVNNNNTKHFILKPNDLAVYNGQTKHLAVEVVDPEKYIGWRDRKYNFEKVTLEDLCTELKQYYGKTFTIRDEKIRKQQLSGTLELQDEETLIQTLSTLLGVRVFEKGDEIIIVFDKGSEKAS